MSTNVVFEKKYSRLKQALCLDLVIKSIIKWETGCDEKRGGIYQYDWARFIREQISGIYKEKTGAM